MPQPAPPIHVPVLVTGFNRPLLLSRVLNQLRDFGVCRIYVSLDGPRPGNEEDTQMTLACRELVRAIDWAQSLSVRVSDENLGCGLAMSSALDWFFSQEKYGVILEDDVIPSLEFFNFTCQMLDLYRDVPEVLMISTANTVPLEHIRKTQERYRFSGIPQVWGWASWADRWPGYRYELADWRRGWTFFQRWQAMGGRLGAFLFWSRTFDRVARGELDTWDYQLVYLAMRTRTATVIPHVSLIETVGFGPESTHTRGQKIGLTGGQAQGPYFACAPKPDRRADRWMLRHAYGVSFAGLLRRIRSRSERA